MLTDKTWQRLIYLQLYLAVDNLGWYFLQLKGHWYEVERSFYVYELHRKCITVDFQPQGNSIRLRTKFVNRM